MDAATEKKLRREIKKVVGDWSDSTFQTYLRLARRLLDAGLSLEDAVEILDDAYWAAADDHGD